MTVEKMTCEHGNCKSNIGKEYKRLPKEAADGWEDEPIFLCDKHAKGHELFDMFWWTYEQFYKNNIKKQIEEKGEAYVEWASTKLMVVKTVNYLKAKHNLECVWLEKNETWFSLFVKSKK